eukprot:09213.XXX_459440_467810_1 [CDS] Oithona nana genome sequencing.
MNWLWNTIRVRKNKTTKPKDSVVQELKDAHLRVKGSGGGGQHRRRTSEEREQDANNPLLEDMNLPGTSSSRVQLDPNGFVLPKKLFNPCVESRECQELHREIKWNAKAGVKVLNTKSELERVMEKRNRHRKDQEKIVEQEATKTPFQKMLEERAKRLEMIESSEGGHSSEDSGHCSPEPENEFLKVHALLRGKNSGGSSS